MTGGGSGGHITPILSLAHELKRLSPNCFLIYVGLKGETITGLQDRLAVFDEVQRIPAGKLRRFHGRGGWLYSLNPKTIYQNSVDSLRLLKGYRQSKRLIRRFKPAVVFSKGGYVAVPVCIAAHRAKVPIITHDSDSVPGLANRIAARWASLKTSGFPTGDPSRKVVGIPLDERVIKVNQGQQRKYKRQLGLDETSKVLLVGGAGLGSENLNELTLKAAPKLLEQFPQLTIINLTGDKTLEKTRAAYKQQLSAEQNRRVKLLGFVDDFYVYSGAADLIVSRAGATSIAEFATQGKACIFIPAAWLPGGQQVENAKVLSKDQAAVILDNDINWEDYYRQIAELLNDDKKRQQLAAKLTKLAKPAASQQLAKLILETAQAKS